MNYNHDRTFIRFMFGSNFYEFSMDLLGKGGLENIEKLSFKSYTYTLKIGVWLHHFVLQVNKYRCPLNN